VIGSRWQLIAFIAPLAGVLASIGWQRRPPALTVHARPAMTRCFENERVQTTAELTADGDAVAAVELSAVAGMEVEVLDGGTAARASIATSASRWGRYPVRARVRALAPGGLLAGTATADVADIYVFPVVPPQPTGIPRTELPDRLGTHLTRHLGPGVEFADIRATCPVTNSARSTGRSAPAGAACTSPSG
jgi:uncharacterized protein (DUF58 family)